MTRRPDWLSDKIVLEQYRARHRREAPKGCRCAFCLSPADFARMIEAALARNPGRDQEVPF